MKSFLFTAIVAAGVLLGSCTGNSNTSQPVDMDAQRADSMWKVHIADSISRGRGIAKDATADTDAISVEAVTHGMKEGLGKVQQGLDKAKQITEAGSKTAKGVADGIKKTSDAIHKTVDETKKTLNGE